MAVRPDAPNLATWIDLIIETTGLSMDGRRKLTLDEDWLP
jgi:hypothetical protein